MAALYLTMIRTSSARFRAIQARCYHALALLLHYFELVKCQPGLSDSHAMVHRPHPCGDFLLRGCAADADYDFTQPQRRTEVRVVAAVVILSLEVTHDSVFVLITPSF